MIGKIIKINGRSVQTKRGPSTVYSMILQQENGQESGWIGLGFTAPTVQEGQWVDVEVYKNKGGYDTVDVINVIENRTPKAAAQAAAANAGAGTAVRKPFIDRNDSIVYQSSRKDALSLVEVLISQGALPISSAKTAAGTAKRYDEIRALVDKLTVQYYFDVQTLRVLEQVEDAGEIEDDSGSLPSEDDDSSEGDGAEDWGDKE